MFPFMTFYYVFRISLLMRGGEREREKRSRLGAVLPINASLRWKGLLTLYLRYLWIGIVKCDALHSNKSVSLHGYFAWSLLSLSWGSLVGECHHVMLNTGLMMLNDHLVRIRQRLSSMCSLMVYSKFISRGQIQRWYVRRFKLHIDK